MRRVGIVVAALAVTLAAPGCATMWLASQIAAGRPPFDENVHEEGVPLPGVTEGLHVTLRLDGPPRPAPAGTSAGMSPPAPLPPQDAVVECKVEQHASERNYRASTRYGRKWKWASGLSFLIEGGLATALLLTGEKPSEIGSGGFLALDALGSGILFFVPRRDRYDQEDREVHTLVRNDCPDGLVLELVGRPVPVDAAGHLDELGLVLLKQHVNEGRGPIRARLSGLVAELYASYTARVLDGELEVPVGQLSAEVAAAPK